MNLLQNCCVVVLMICLLLFAEAAIGVGLSAGKKLIEFGWDYPSTEYVRHNIREMEKVPFDGVVIDDGCAWTMWCKTPLDKAKIDKSIENLKATKFKRFTDNFGYMVSSRFAPAEQDEAHWFDSDWSVVAENAAQMARMAKQGGMVGILFDAEQYGKNKIWDYDEAKKDIPFEQYRDKVRERGREFIRAINSEFPDVTILVIWAYELPILYDGPYGQRYGVLLTAFLDGMCEAATPRTSIVDGFEYAYGFISQDAFKLGRKMVMDQARNTISLNPNAFDKHVRLALPVYPDMWSSQSLPFDYENVEKNLFTPELFRAALANALKETDKYVWVYTEHLRWWNNTKPDTPATAPKEYIRALSLARSCVRIAETPDRVQWPHTVIRFAEQTWKTKSDAGNVGVAGGWFEAGFDDAGWDTTKPAESVGELKETVKGYRWYRLKFKGPDVAKDKRIYIHISTKDEVGTVWLNGKYVGTHDLRKEARYNVFALEITDTLEHGKENTLVVRLENTEGESGLSNPIGIVESGYVYDK